MCKNHRKSSGFDISRSKPEQQEAIVAFVSRISEFVVVLPGYWKSLLECCYLGWVSRKVHLSHLCTTTILYTFRLLNQGTFKKRSTTYSVLILLHCCQRHMVTTSVAVL